MYVYTNVCRMFLRVNKYLGKVLAFLRVRCHSSWHSPESNNKCMCTARFPGLNVRRHSSMSLQIGHSVDLVLRRFILRLLLNSTVELHVTDTFPLTAFLRGLSPIDSNAWIFSISQIFLTSSLRAKRINWMLFSLPSWILSQCFSCAFMEMFLVQILALFSSPFMCCSSSYLSSHISLIKWCRVSMCFVRCPTCRFFTNWIAPMLSLMI